jgi:hypothetical protein
MASWFTPEQKAEMRRKAGEALAMCDAALERAAHHQRTTVSAGLVFKDRDNARVEPDRVPEERTLPVQTAELVRTRYRQKSTLPRARTRLR